MTQRKTRNSTTTELHCTMEKPVFFGGRRLQKMCVAIFGGNFPSTKNVASIFRKCPSSMKALEFFCGPTLWPTRKSCFFQHHALALRCTCTIYLSIGSWKSRVLLRYKNLNITGIWPGLIPSSEKQAIQLHECINGVCCAWFCTDVVALT